MDTTDSASETDGGKAAKLKKTKEESSQGKVTKTEKECYSTSKSTQVGKKSVSPTKSPPKSPACPAIPTNVNPIPQTAVGGLDIGAIPTLTATDRVSCL